MVGGCEAEEEVELLRRGEGGDVGGDGGGEGGREVGFEGGGYQGGGCAGLLAELGREVLAGDDIFLSVGPL